MSNRSGHMPVLPDYRRAEFKDRNLFLLERQTLYDEHESATKVHSLDDIYDLVFNQNGMALCESIASREEFPWLDTLICSKYADVLCNKKGKPLAVILKKG